MEISHTNLTQLLLHLHINIIIKTLYIRYIFVVHPSVPPPLRPPPHSPSEMISHPAAWDTRLLTEWKNEQSCSDEPSAEREPDFKGHNDFRHQKLCQDQHGCLSLSQFEGFELQKFCLVTSDHTLEATKLGMFLNILILVSELKLAKVQIRYWSAIKNIYVCIVAVVRSATATWEPFTESTHLQLLNVTVNSCNSKHRLGNATMCHCVARITTCSLFHQHDCTGWAVRASQTQQMGLYIQLQDKSQKH